VVDNKLDFKVKNFIVASENNMLENTGIGINNVKRRLELMYPEKHKLKYEAKDNFYFVHLEIQLS
jgi:LytS/YehU family sensor histidine kinase